MERKEKIDSVSEAMIVGGEFIVGLTAPDFLVLTSELSVQRRDRLDQMLTGQSNNVGLHPEKLLQPLLDTGMSAETSAFLLASFTSAMVFDFTRRTIKLIKAALSDKNG